MSFDKFSVRVPKFEPKPVVVRSRRQMAEEYAELIHFVDGIGALAKMAMMELVRREVSSIEKQMKAMEIIDASMGVAIESHRAELREAFIGDICDKYDDEELAALLSFHGSRVGRQISGKEHPTARRTSLVMKQIDMMARSILDGMNKSSSSTASPLDIQ